MLLARALDEERNRSELLDVRGIHAAACLNTALPREAVVGGHDDQRVVVDLLLVEAAHEPAEQPVGVPELQEVALLVVAGEELVMEPRRGVHARKQVARARAGLHSRWQVEVGPVREQQVLHPEGRPPSGADAAHPALEALRTPAHHVGNDRRRLGARAATHRGRAERRSLLGGDDPVALALEHVKHTVRMPGAGGRRPGPRAHAVEDQRDGLGRRVIRRIAVAKPDGVAGQCSEVRIAHRVDLPALVEQRVAGELVEDEQHDVRLGSGCLTRLGTPPRARGRHRHRDRHGEDRDDDPGHGAAL